MPDATTLVVDPHPVVREGLTVLLHGEGLEVVAVTGTAAMAESLAARHEPDVVLLAEGRLPDARGRPVVTRLLQGAPRAAVVLYVDGNEADAVQGALRAGAAGVVSTARPAAQIARALRAAANGGTWFGEHDEAGAELPAAALEPARRTRALSDRERLVLALVADGSSTEVIAGALGVSPHTIRTHVRNLLRKLDAQSRAHAVAIAMREAAIDV